MLSLNCPWRITTAALLELLFELELELTIGVELKVVLDFVGVGAPVEPPPPPPHAASKLDVSRIIMRLCYTFFCL